MDKSYIYIGNLSYFTYGKKYNLSLSSTHASGKRTYSLYNDDGGIYYTHESKVNEFVTIAEFRALKLNKLGIYS